MSIETSSDALVDVVSSHGSDDVTRGRVTAVGRAVYVLKVGDWVYVAPGVRRGARGGARVRVAEADVNCLRLPQSGVWASVCGNL